MSNTQRWGMDESKPKEEGRFYKPRVTTSIILGYAIFNMTIGIILIILGIIGIINVRYGFILGIGSVYLIIIGFSFILFSSLVYIIGALSKDVYEIVYFSDYMAAKNDIYYRYMVQHMWELEKNQEAIKSGIAVISSKLNSDNEKTRLNRFSRKAELNQMRDDSE